MPGARMLKMVVMKLMAPRIEDAPDRWIDRMTRSTAGPGCAAVANRADRASSRRHGRATPGAPGTNMDRTNRRSETTSSQNEMLFMRGKAMSGAPIMIGTNQLPKPPISAGMMTKKIMTSPCALTTTL